MFITINKEDNLTYSNHYLETFELVGK